MFPQPRKQTEKQCQKRWGRAEGKQSSLPFAHKLLEMSPIKQGDRNRNFRRFLGLWCEPVSVRIIPHHILSILHTAHIHILPTFTYCPHHILSGQHHRELLDMKGPEEQRYCGTLSIYGDQ